MCMCGKPTVNGQEGYSWNGESFSVRHPDPPRLKDGDTVLFDEPGRCGGIDSHCHHHTVVSSLGCLYLLTRNGAGDNRIRLSGGRLAEALGALDSHGRYWVLNAIYYAFAHGERVGSHSTEMEWSRAAAEKRIRTRKQRGWDNVKVWIES